MNRSRVLFVSKPIVAPYRDGTKCLVRDIATHLQSFEPHVMGAPRSGDLPGVVVENVYDAGGGYTPGLRQNLRAASWLATSRGASLWHYVFAPNPRTSQMGRWLRRLRSVPVLQTIASAPRDFSEPQGLLFGDRVVAQSRWTRDRFIEAFAERQIKAPPIDVILPPAPFVDTPSSAAKAAVQGRLDAKRGEPVFVYPGDLEVSGGAEFVVELSRGLAERMPMARVVFAYRDKTPRARRIAEELERRTDSSRVLFERNVGSIHALLATATAVVFPVDDLYGKVDLPIVLLEALQLGTPVLALDAGPLRDLTGAALLPRGISDWLDVMGRLTTDLEFQASLSAAGKAAASGEFAAARVAQAYEAVYEAILARQEP